EYYNEEICAGDVLTRVTKIADLQERPGRAGTMLIVVGESNYYNSDGKLMATERNTEIFY
ncbi:MAG: MaoC family dehydratase N-terminal domain-containing protein, partial [Dehalococcoidia bacterium]